MESKPGGTVDGYGSVVPSVVNVTSIVLRGWVVDFFHISESKFQNYKNQYNLQLRFFVNNAEVDTHEKKPFKIEFIKGNRNKATALLIVNFFTVTLQFYPTWMRSSLAET